MARITAKQRTVVRTALLWRTDGAWPTWETLPGLTVTIILEGAAG